MSKNPQKPTKSAGRSKREKIITLLQRNNGATIAELAKATGWQRHSVHGFMWGILKKKQGQTITSSKEEDKERRYRIMAGCTMTNVSLETQNFELMNLSTIEFGKLWRLNISEKVPNHLPKPLLARLLAYRLQVEQQGGLSKRAITYLKAIETDLRNGNVPKTPYPEEQRLKPGCQLLREHDGIDHRVTVLDGGYQWNGKVFASLSSVAKTITGTNWNGHRFFGFKAKVPASAEVAS